MLFEALFEQIGHGVFVADSKGDLLEVNQRFCDMLGYTRDELLGLSMSHLFLGEDMAYFIEKSKKISDKKKHTERCRLRNKEGDLLVANFMLLALADGHLMGLVHDFGEQSRIELQFNESEESFRLLAELSLTGIYQIEDGGFSYVNKAFAEMFGYEVNEVLHELSMVDLIYPEDRALVIENVRRRVTGEEDSIRYSFRGLHRSGEIIHVDVHGRRVIDSSGKTGVIGTLIDITEVKKAEEGLKRLNEELEARIKERTHELERSYQELKLAHTTLLQQEKMASIGQLAAGIAHEINTPVQFVGDNIAFLRESLDELLEGVQTFMEIATSADDTIPVDSIKNDLKNVLTDIDFQYLKEEIPLAFDSSADGIKRISNIVAAMKDFAHPSGDTLQPVNLETLINSTVEISRNSWKMIAELVVELDSTPLIVDGLRDELGQVLLNLITNAADAIAEVQQKDKLGLIRVLARVVEDSWAEIIVEDSGCGIPPDLREKIFDPFFTTKPVGRGSGQGLTIAYHIIKDKHGGELLLDSVPGKGSTFTVRLPLSK